MLHSCKNKDYKLMEDKSKEKIPPYQLAKRIRATLEAIAANPNLKERPAVLLSLAKGLVKQEGRSLKI